MALPKVTINKLNGALGGVTPLNDGEAGIIISVPELPSTGITDPFAIGTPKTITSLQDVIDRGITADYDADPDGTGTYDPINVYRHFKEFFDTAGASGPVLHVLFVADTVSLEDMLDTGNQFATKLLDFADTIKLLAVARNPASAYTPTVTNGIDKDAYDALVTGQALADQYQAIPQPIQILIEGRSFDGEPANLKNLKQQTENHCSIVLSSSKDDDSASVALALGRLAAIPVQRKISRVQDGALPITTAYYNSSTPVEEQSQAYQGLIHNAGFVTLRTIPRLGGFFFSDDPTATGASDDYNIIARHRVIKKMIMIAYDTYLRDLNDEILTAEGGTLPDAVAADIKARVERAIEQTMVVPGELSAVRADVDPSQNVVSTGEIRIQLFGRPVGYTQFITVDLGFEL